MAAISRDTSLEEIPTPEELAPLFEPVQVGRFELKTRAVYAPLTRCRAMGAVPIPEAAIYYSQRANPGQLMISEATGVTHSTVGYGYPNSPGLHSAEQVEAWQPVVKAVHDKGAIFFAQLWHVGRASLPAFEDGNQPVSASDIAIQAPWKAYHPETFEEVDYPVPRPLETDEVKAIVQHFRNAARNAVKVAGFDGVEIHATNGYLINQFLDDRSNKRTDEYGGSVENRCRFCLEIVQAISEEIGSDRVGIRLGAFTEFLDAGDSDPYGLYSYLVEKLNDYNLAYMHFIEPRVLGNNDRTDESPHTNEPFLKLCKTKIILAGGFISASGQNLGPETLREGRADLVAYGRWALANPDFLLRLKLGAPLNKYDRNTFYVPGLKGYTDYPRLEETDYGAKYLAQ